MTSKNKIIKACSGHICYAVKQLGELSVCIPRPSGTWLSSTRILSSQGLGVLLPQDTCMELQAEGGGHRHTR